MQARSSFLQERELVLADLELVAVLEPGRRVDPLPVQEGAVEAPLVLDVEAALPLREDGVFPRDGHVVEEDVALRGAPDRGSLALRDEVLAGPPAAGPHD